MYYTCLFQRGIIVRNESQQTFNSCACNKHRLNLLCLHIIYKVLTKWTKWFSTDAIFGQQLALCCCFFSKRKKKSCNQDYRAPPTDWVTKWGRIFSRQRAGWHYDNEKILMYSGFFGGSKHTYTPAPETKHNTNIHRVYTLVLQTYWGFVTYQVILQHDPSVILFSNKREVEESTDIWQN